MHFHCVYIVYYDFSNSEMFEEHNNKINRTRNSCIVNIF